MRRDKFSCKFAIKAKSTNDANQFTDGLNDALSLLGTGRDERLLGSDCKCKTWKMKDLENDGTNRRAGKCRTK